MKIKATHRDTGQTINGTIVTTKQAFPMSYQQLGLDPDELLVKEQFDDSSPHYFKLELLHTIYCKDIIKGDLPTEQQGKKSYEFPNANYPRSYQSLFSLIENDIQKELPILSRAAIQEYFGYRDQEQKTKETDKSTKQASPDTRTVVILYLTAYIKKLQSEKETQDHE